MSSLYTYGYAHHLNFYSAHVSVYLAEPVTGVPSCECVCVYIVPGSLNLSVSGARLAPACLRALWMCSAQGGGGWLILCCPCRFPISRPVTVGAGVTADQHCLPPTSAFPFCGLSGSRHNGVTGHSVPVGLFCHGQHVLAGVFACADFYDLIIVSMCTPCICVCWRVLVLSHYVSVPG